MYAVIETGGKQYQVKPGDEVFVEKLDVNAEDAVTFDKVMVVGADDGIKVGAPYVDGASVTAKVIKNGKSKKVTVFTYKPKVPAPAPDRPPGGAARSALDRCWQRSPLPRP